MRRKEENITQLVKRLKKAIEAYLNLLVIKPALQTVDKELLVQQDIANILCVFDVVEKLILLHGDSIDKDSFTSLSKEDRTQTLDTLNVFVTMDKQTIPSSEIKSIFDKHLNRKHLFAYLKREIHWISVSLLAASYISTMILSRSIFELLIGLSTKVTGGMSDRINSITFLTEDEKKIIKKSWNNLNSWTHPYGRWEKEVCPVYISCTPLYHPLLYKQCIEEMRILTDMTLLIASHKYAIAPQLISDNLCENRISLEEMKNFPFFSKRINLD